MQAEIITIGDEILIGQVIDTNSAWLGTQLNLSGISVKQITSVSDNKEHILEALHLAEKRVDIIIITGGLGPTKDDITKHTLCGYFKTTLVENKEVLEWVKHLFTSKNRPLLEVNLKQAEVPANCRVLHNKQGTAPGMWFDHNGKIFISMPGVPAEMKGIFSDHVLPGLKSV
ncbi:MAG TPA: competence/damage-inducible protein A, partial [Bacteroidia bacterium]|nr:competence/damage-inducible protein A [Bacteroidia bacterium]